MLSLKTLVTAAYVAAVVCTAGWVGLTVAEGFATAAQSYLGR